MWNIASLDAAPWTASTPSPCLPTSWHGRKKKNIKYKWRLRSKCRNDTAHILPTNTARKWTPVAGTPQRCRRVDAGVSVPLDPCSCPNQPRAHPARHPVRPRRPRARHKTSTRVCKLFFFTVHCYYLRIIESLAVKLSRLQREERLAPPLPPRVPPPLCSWR